jgi:hypothetical protein
MVRMLDSEPRSKVPGIFVILLVVMCLGLLIPPRFDHRWWHWPERMVAYLAVGLSCAYATDKFPRRKKKSS